MNDFIRHGFRGLVSMGYRGYGLDVFGRFKWLQETMSWPAGKRLEWRLQRLGDILEFAWTHVPFYREYWGDHGVSFSRPRALEDLKRYPVLTKAVFRANVQRFVPDNLESIRHIHKSTGGTTGEPVRFLQDMEQWALIQAFHWWGWGLAGYQVGDPVGLIAGGAVLPEAMTFKVKARLFVERRCFLFGINMSRELAVDYHRRLQRFRAKYLYGYPSVLFMFARHLREEKLALPALKAVITTSEILFPHYRKGIEEGLGCPVFDDFGCNDGGFQAYECSRHQGMHYNDLQAVLEVAEPDAAGKGRLLITNLWNKSMPFVRYENGDLVALADALCPCGTAFPMISSVEGRTYDLLTFSNGRCMSGSIIVHIMGKIEGDSTRFSGVDGYQAVQTAPDALELRVREPRGVNPEASRYFQEVFRRYLGEEVRLTIREVEALEVTKAGKLKPVWSEIPTLR